MRLLPIFSFIYLFPLAAIAQQFGGNPPSLKWDQINTDTARIIFPEGLDSVGERVANMVHYLNANDRKSIGSQEWKLDLVLQNQTTIANAYVAVGPFRSEFGLTPFQSSNSQGSVNWTDFLCVHEYRHALQYMNFRSGISRDILDVFGQQGYALAINAVVPDWFWEGDAVFMETALTDQGRGRLPSFMDGFRGLMLAHTDYSYQKIRNGSLQDLVPDHYPLGYMLCAYGRQQYGNQFWKKVTQDAVRYKGLFYPLSRSIQRRTGENVREFYHSALSFYQKHWTASYDSSWKTRSVAYTKTNPRLVTNYRYPVFINADTLLVLRSTFRNVPAFYLVDNQGHGEKLTTQGIINDDYFSYSDGRIAWMEYRTDPRWGWKDYGVLKIYDLHSGKKRTLSHLSRYFSPDLSPGGNRVVVTEVSTKIQDDLKILDASTGRLINTLPNPGPYFYTYPRFTADGRAIISTVRNAQGEMALIRQEISGDQITILVPFSNKTLGIPIVARKHIYFSASIGPVNNIYAVGLQGGTIYQVTGEPNGCYQAAVNPTETKLVFSAFTIHGYQLRQMKLDSSRFRPVPEDALTGINDLFVGKALREEGSDILNRVPHRWFPVTRYRQTAGLIHFHSLLPNVNDPDYSLDLISNNTLNTMDIATGYTYNRNEHSSSAGVNATYSGLYPWINAGASYTFDRNLVNGQGSRIYWNEFDYNTGLSIPLNFSSGNDYYSLTGGSSFYSTQVQFIPNAKFHLRDFTVNYFNAYFGFTRQRQQAVQNIFSHFAQSIYIQYNKTLSGVYAEQLFAIGDFYFPGLFANHSIVLEGDFQQRDNQHEYNFPDDFIYSRGYNPGNYSYIGRIAGNYHFPIVYPDAGFAGIVYFLRIRGNIFYDYSMSGTQSARGYIPHFYRSTGLEVFFDTQWWNEYPVTFGLRYSRLLDPDPLDPFRKHLIELVVPLQLF